MDDYRKRYNYDELREGRMYVLHVHREGVRHECLSEDELCSMIDAAEAEYPDSGLTVIQMAARV